MFVLLIAALFAPLPSVEQPPEILTAVRVQGNVATPEQDIVALAAVQVGEPVPPDVVEAVTARLVASKRFEHVEVRKRFASIADPTQIVLVIVVDEGPVSIEFTGDPDRPTRVVRRRRLNLMVLPILTAEDGYGVTYGARFAVANPIGERSRLAFPLSWGGYKRASAELVKDFTSGPITHAETGVSIGRRKHPFFEEDDDRYRVWGRVERTAGPAIRVGASAGWQHVSFLGDTDRLLHGGADLVIDTRNDPVLARNAVYARAAWEHDRFSNAAANRLELEGRGYVGLVGQNIVVLRVVRTDSDRPLPPYMKAIFGGPATVRGFATGTAVGDTLVAGSAELRVPLTSPLSVGKIGVSGFLDAGAVYDKGARLANQELSRGVGAGLWFSAAFVRMDVAVAHGLGSSTRVHFGGGISF